MGIGQVITLRLPASRLREVNRVLEDTAWGAYRTEFYPTYDYKAIGMAEHDKARHLQHAHPEFDRGGRAVMAKDVWLKGRNERGDVAQHKQLAGDGAKDRLWIDTRIRTGDDHGFRRLAPMGERFVASALVGPNLGAKFSIAFDQRVHHVLRPLRNVL